MFIPVVTVGPTKNNCLSLTLFAYFFRQSWLQKLYYCALVQKTFRKYLQHIAIIFQFYSIFICSLSFKTFEETTEDENNPKVIEGKNQKSLEKPKEFKERYT